MNLDLDSFREITTSIKKNMLRTTLTGFSIAWGIFMLIFLLGAGNGLKNGVMANFSNRSQNTLIIWGGKTSIPHKGMPIGRDIKFDSKDYDLIRNRLPNVIYVSAQIRQNKIISYAKEYGSWSLFGVYPDAAPINKIQLIKGRFINNMDMDNRRKVIVINTEMRDILFKGEEPIGKYVTAEDITFQVIGVYEDQNGRSDVPAYIPFTVAKGLYNKNFGFDRIEFTVDNINSKEENEAYLYNIRKQMGKLHNFNPDDKAALVIWNNVEDAIQTQSIFNTITIFTWVVGVATLMAGIVGVGNIMLITVKERTREFGIRKAIGATPASVLKLVLLESVMITSVFGYLGMLIGIVITELINNYLQSSGTSGSGSKTVFLNPTVDLKIAISATLVLVVAGVFAGYIPAKKAVSIKPIEAMRAE